MNKKKAVKAAMIILGPVVLFLLPFYLLFGMYLIDETYLEGEAYGFKVGQTKQQVFATIRREYEKDTVVVYLETEVIRRGRAYIKANAETTSVVDAKLAKLVGFDRWDLHFNGDIRDVLWILFEDGIVVEIYRGRTIDAP